MAAYGPEPLYRATGVIMVEQPEISPDLATSTVAGVIEQRMQLVSRRVMRSENLRPLVEEFDMYPELEPSDRAPQLRMNTFIEQVDPISFEPLVGGSAFSIHFDYPDPAVAQQVALALIDLFVADNREIRTQSAAGTESFFAAEAERLATSITEAEDRLAKFKQLNIGALPEDIERNKLILERIGEDRNEVLAEIRLAVERRNLLTVQLGDLSGGTELSKLRAELAVASQKYSADHPDIKRLSRAIAALESSGENANTMDAEYMRVSAQLAAVEEAIAAATMRDRELQRRQSELEGKQVLAPEVEKELLQLTREYELAKSEYESIREKRSEARIGSNLEDQDKGQRYTVIRQPYADPSPISPNRVGIFLIGILFAIGGSAALVSLRESADTTVRGARDVEAVLQGPPIAVIPIIRNEDDSRRRFKQLAVHGAALIVVGSLTIGIVLNG